jgi:hypothetical protein
VRAELFRADRRTDRYDEANSSFSKFCERARKLIFDKILCNIPQSIPGYIYLCHSRFLVIHQSHNDPNNRIYSTNSVQKASSDILQNNKHKTTRYMTLTTQLSISIALICTFFKHMLKQRTPDTKTRSLPSIVIHTACPAM